MQHIVLAPEPPRQRQHFLEEFVVGLSIHQDEAARMGQGIGKKA